MRRHFNVIIRVVLKEVLHLYDVGVLQAVSAKIVEDMDLKWYSTEAPISSPSINENPPFRHIFQNDFLPSIMLVAGQFDLAIGTLAHIFQNDKIIYCLLPGGWFHNLGYWRRRLLFWLRCTCEF